MPGCHDPGYPVFFQFFYKIRYTSSMISRYTHQGLTWIDLESPTPAEATALMEEYAFHPIIAGELVTKSERSKIDVYENAVYLILHFPLSNRLTGHIEETEIDFVLMKDTLITTHYELVDPLHDFAKLFEMDSYLNDSAIGEHAGLLFFLQMRELYKNTLFLLESVETEIRQIEKEVFNGDETKMVEKLSKTNRALIDIRSSLRSHKDTLKSFGQTCSKMYGPEFTYYMNMIESEYAHIEQTMEESRQMLNDLRKTNDSLLSTKTNATMRRLTVVNVIMLPLGLISWIFAMHSKYLYLDEPRQLFVVFGGMALLALILVMYFRSKKWL